MNAGELAHTATEAAAEAVEATVEAAVVNAAVGAAAYIASQGTPHTPQATPQQVASAVSAGIGGAFTGLTQYGPRSALAAGLAVLHNAARAAQSQHGADGDTQLPDGTQHPAAEPEPPPAVEVEVQTEQQQLASIQMAFEVRPWVMSHAFACLQATNHLFRDIAWNADWRPSQQNRWQVTSSDAAPNATLCNMLPPLHPGGDPIEVPRPIHPPHHAPRPAAIIARQLPSPSPQQLALAWLGQEQRDRQESQQLEQQHALELQAVLAGAGDQAFLGVGPLMLWQQQQTMRLQATQNIRRDAIIAAFTICSVDEISSMFRLLPLASSVNTLLLLLPKLAPDRQAAVLKGLPTAILLLSGGVFMREYQEAVQLAAQPAPDVQVLLPDAHSVDHLGQSGQFAVMDARPRMPVHALNKAVNRVVKEDDAFLQLQKITGQPVSFQKQKELEALAFFHLYPDGKGSCLHDDRRLRTGGLSTCFRRRLWHNSSRSRRNTDWMAWALHIMQYKQILGGIAVSICLNRGATTVHELGRALQATHNDGLDAGTRQNAAAHASEISYACVRNARSTSAYWSHVKKEIFTFIQQVGCPTLFTTLSANDVGWDDIAITLGYSGPTSNWRNWLSKQGDTTRYKLLIDNHVPVICWCLHDPYLHHLIPLAFTTWSVI